MKSTNLKLDATLLNNVSEALAGNANAEPRALEQNELLAVFGAGPDVEGSGRPV